MADQKDKSAAFLPIGVGLGVSLGTAIGIATDNLALWLSLGVAIGSGLGVALMGAAKARSKKDAGADETDAGSDGRDNLG